MKGKIKAMHREFAQTEASSYTNALAASGFLANPLPESAAAAAIQEAPFLTPRFDFSTQPVAAFPAKKRRRRGGGNQAAQANFVPPSNYGSPAAQFSSPPQGVSSCYVFKSRLQEYAQKKGLATPVYETIKEGPSHEPSFRSTVIVKDVRYDSLPGFFNRKAAEQSAAEVALTELGKSDEVECISQPVHETGLCKNLLQEYAQKMNYAMPLYQCLKNETPGRAANFKCTVEIGGIQYIGASAKTKREAEIKAARTALLAIQSSTSESSHISLGNSQLTVIPFRKKGAATAAAPEEGVNVPKAKKPRFKKKMSKKKFSKFKAKNNHSKQAGKLDVIMDQQSRLESDQTCLSVVQAAGSGLLPVSAVASLQDGSLVSEFFGKETTNDIVSTPNQIVANDFEDRSTVDFNQSIHGMSTGISLESLDVIVDRQSRSESDQTCLSVVQVTGNGQLSVSAIGSLQDGSLDSEFRGKEMTNDVANQNVADYSGNRSTVDFNQDIHGMSTGISSVSNDVIVDRQSRSESVQTCLSAVQATGNGLLPVSADVSLQDGGIVSEFHGKETTNDVDNQNVANDSEKRSTVDCNQSIHGMSTGVSSESHNDATKVSGVALTEAGPSTVIAGLNPLTESTDAGAGQI